MSALRQAAQQALEALQDFKRRGHWGDFDNLTGTLQAALVEDAMQKFTDVNQELEAALAEPEGGGNLPPTLQLPAEVAATITTTDIAWLATRRLTKLWQELGQMRWLGADEGWDRAIEAVRSRLNDECQAVLDWKAKADQSQATAVQLLRKMQGVKDD